MRDVASDLFDAQRDRFADHDAGFLHSAQSRFQIGACAFVCDDQNGRCFAVVILLAHAVDRNPCLAQRGRDFCQRTRFVQ